MDLNGKVLNLTDGKVLVSVLGDDGNYGKPIMWYGTQLHGWSSNDGQSVIGDDEAIIGCGKGLMINNSVKADADNNESKAKSGVHDTAIKFMVSGEVDLVCKNIAPSGYSVTGNSTPVTINLNQIKPTDLNGKELNLTDGKVLISLLGDDGNYGKPIMWYGTQLHGWSSNDGLSVIGDDEAVLTPGKGIMISNSVKADADNNESKAKSGVHDTPIILSLPIPISK